MKCNGCGRPDAVRVKIYGDGVEICDAKDCGNLSIGEACVPDVWFPGPYIDPNLAHPKRPWEIQKVVGGGDGVLVTSKRHKARLLREQGLHEAGDRRRGMRREDKAAMKRAVAQGFAPMKI